MRNNPLRWVTRSAGVKFSCCGCGMLQCSVTLEPGATDAPFAGSGLSGRRKPITIVAEAEGGAISRPVAVVNRAATDHV